MRIERNYKIPEGEDFALNVFPYIGEGQEFVEIYHKNVLVAWKIQKIF